MLLAVGVGLALIAAAATARAKGNANGHESPATPEQKRRFMETAPITGGWTAYERGRGSGVQTSTGG
jgi:hypothetical protein